MMTRQHIGSLVATAVSVAWIGAGCQFDKVDHASLYDDLFDAEAIALTPPDASSDAKPNDAASDGATSSDAAGDAPTADATDDGGSPDAGDAASD